MENTYKVNKKAVEKIIERVYDNGSTVINKDDLEEIFPELKESEDEIVIAALKSGINGLLKKEYHLKGIGGISFDRIIAWLEKQGEKKSTKEKLQALSDGKRHLGWLDDADKVIEGEQKPAFEMKTPEESLGVDSDTYNKIVDECIYGEQKPAWSEEDKRIIDNLISQLGNLFARKLIKEETKDKYVNWLKSLRPQNTWKPSDEQMKQLGWIAKQNKDNMIGKELMSLYQDLKKLSEEQL